MGVWTGLCKVMRAHFRENLHLFLSGVYGPLKGPQYLTKYSIALNLAGPMLGNSMSYPPASIYNLKPSFADLSFFNLNVSLV